MTIVQLRTKLQNLPATLNTPALAARYMEDRVFKAQEDQREHFWALMLDVKRAVKAEPFLVSLGSVSATMVHPRETFREACKISASSVILMHNHPSGDPAPSTEDDILTHRLVAAGKILGITVTDHIVICSPINYYSYQDHGRLNP